MLHFFRRFFKSKFGLAITMGFLVLIAFAFASMDVSSTNPTFGGIAGDNNVAVVGDTAITAADFQTAMNSELETQRQQEPTLTMQALIARGAADRVIDQLMQRAALTEWGKRHGLRVGKRLVDSELVKIPAFFGADGKFSRESFLAVLGQQRISESAIRADIANGLMAQQILLPASQGTTVPVSLAKQYAVLLRERRTGAIATLPSEAFAPANDPSAAQLAAYHQANGGDYIRPERRVIRYALLNQQTLGNIAPPTDAQIAQRYQQNRAQYAARETRTVTQMVVASESAAQSVVAQVAGGVSMEAAARNLGLSTTKVGPVTKAQLAGQSSQAVADAAFSAAQGAVAPPRRGSLGWYVLKIDQIQRSAERSLADVRDELRDELATEQRRTAFIDTASRIEEQFDEGSSLSEVVGELGAELETTQPLTAEGRVYGTSQTVSNEVAPILRSAFDMDENEPQIAAAPSGDSFIVFAVSDITPSAVAPLAEIRSDVIADWKRSEGAKRAKAAAARILQRVEKGQSLAAAVAAEEIRLPAPESINMGRQELSQIGRVPPVLALLFSMAEGTVKQFEGPQDAGWFVVQLDEIAVPEIEGEDPLIAQTRQQLKGVFGDEYAEQFINAALAEVGASKNQAAIDAVLNQLTGQAAE